MTHESTGQLKTQWAGSALLAIASLHTVFALFLGSGAVSTEQTKEWVGDRAPLALMHPGFGSEQPFNLFVLLLFWSIFFGLTLMMLGFLVRYMEKRRLPVPKTLGLMLVVVCLVGAILVPASGFWLALIPAIQIIRGGV